MMTVEAILKEDGDLALHPDDHYTEFGMPVYDWLLREDASHPYAYPTCVKAYERALFQYLKSSERKDFIELRSDPYVIRNYDTLTETQYLVFIFKEDNNGTTYRIKATY